MPDETNDNPADETLDETMADDAVAEETPADDQPAEEGEAEEVHADDDEGGDSPAGDAAEGDEPAAADEVAADEVEPGADPLAAEYDAALDEIDQDETLSPSERRIKKLQVQEMREARQDRRVKAAKVAEENARNREAKKHGVSRPILDSCWARAVKRAKEQPEGFNRAVAMVFLREEVGKVKARKQPAPAAGGANSLAAASRSTRPAIKTNRSGAVLRPPGGGGGGRQAKPRRTAEEIFDNGDWE